MTDDDAYRAYMREYMRRRRAGLNTKGFSRRETVKAPAGFGARAESHLAVPDHVLADARFRNAIPDHIFGDPKPGQSALDKRKERQC